MAVALLAGGLGGLAYIFSTYPTEEDASANTKVPNLLQTGMLKDFNSTGIVLGTIRPFYLAFTELNEAFKPHSAPSQKGTYSLSETFADYGRNQSYEMAHAPDFFFKSPIAQISLATAQQSNPNVIVPDSWSAPPGAQALGHHPRAYQEYKNEALFNETQKNRFTTSGYNTDGGMPTETDVRHDPPDAGVISTEYNPWGPGGLLQNLFNNGLAQRTKKNGTNLSTILGPPAPNAQRGSFLGALNK